METNQLFLTLAATLEDLVFVWRPEGTMLWANPAFVRATGMNPEDFTFPNAENPFIHPGDVQRVTDHIVAFVASASTVSEPIENRFIDIWGRVSVVRTVMHKVTWGGAAAHLSLTTMRHPDPGSAPEVDTQYRRLMDTAFDSVLQVTAEGRIVYSNRRFHAVTQLQHGELVKRTLPSLFVAEHAGLARNAVARIASGHDVATFTGQLATSERWLDLTLSQLDACDLPAVALVVARDVTEARRAAQALAQSEAHLRHAQRMESVGRLAGGVAHDFNNLLTVITGNATMALHALGPGHPVHELLADIEQAAFSAASVTRQLLAFSRKEIVSPRVVDLNTVVRTLQRLLARVIPEDIALVVELDPAPQLVMLDPGQFEQILLNLAVNARDAMPEGGTLKLTSSASTLDEARARSLGVAPGEYVSITVADTGVGISPDVQEHIFEPFYTTKESGHGLGLAMVHGAVTQCQGAIEVRSSPGNGSAFQLLFPSALPSATEALLDSAAPNAGPFTGTETIVVVEDEPSLRALATRVLERLGYAVHAFAQSTAALDFFADDAHRVDALFTDVVMPGMSGRELAERAQKLRPTLRVLFTSGYTSDVVLRRGVMDDRLEFIAKPYSIEQLASRLRKVLDESAEHSSLTPAPIAWPQR
jgi:PAS domain S-box-containing protein